MDDNKKFQLDIEIAKKMGQTEELNYLKFFGTLPRYTFDFYNINDNVLPEFEKYLNDNLNLTEDIYVYEDYSDITKEIDDELEAELRSIGIMESSVSTYIDRKRKLLVTKDYSSYKFHSQSKLDEKTREDLKAIVDKGSKFINNSIHILSYDGNRGMYLTDFKIDDSYKDLDLENNYNEGFIDMNKDLLDKMEKNSVGLYLFHGKPGTGKTTYLRYLIRNVKKRVIFVSPNMSTRLSDPEMIPFLMNYSNSILIIEDAENVIKSRKAGSADNVSNLLNLSDGILGDCLKFQIICTFNTSKEDIDEALLRKGRLIKSYEFDELTTNKANNLLEKLGYDKKDKPLTLSEIYNNEDNNAEFNRKGIGFGKG